MDSLPLARKVNHIEGFRFHPEDTQNEIFDIFVHQMKICEGVDEHGEKCEYMYIHSKDGNIYKALLPYRDFLETFLAKTNENEYLSLSNNISVLKFQLNSFINMIPRRMIGNIGQDFCEKYGKGFFISTAFKCRIGRITNIYHYIHMMREDEDSTISFDEDMIQEIDKFNAYFEKRRRSWRGRSPGMEGYDDTLPGVIQEDIEQGNEILRKLIAYLENLQQEKIGNPDNL